MTGQIRDDGYMEDSPPCAVPSVAPRRPPLFPDHTEVPACRHGLCHACPGCGRVVHTEGGSPCGSCVLAGRA